MRIDGSRLRWRLASLLEPRPFDAVVFSCSVAKNPERHAQQNACHHGKPEVVPLKMPTKAAALGHKRRRERRVRACLEMFSFRFFGEMLLERSFGFFLREGWIEGRLSSEFWRKFGNHLIHNRVEFFHRLPAFGAGDEVFSQFLPFRFAQASRGCKSAEFEELLVLLAKALFVPTSLPF